MKVKNCQNLALRQIQILKLVEQKNLCKIGHSQKELVCLFCCFMSQVNSYSHGGTVSSPNHNFFLGKLEQAVNQYFMHILLLVTDQTLVFKTNYRLMKVISIAECSKGSILQCFGPSLNYHLSLRSLFCLFLIGLFRQFSLYFTVASCN